MVSLFCLYNLWKKDRGTVWSFFLLLLSLWNLCLLISCSHQQLVRGGVKRGQHATAEGHSEDSHPDAWGLPPAHTTGPGNICLSMWTHNLNMLVFTSKCQYNVDELCNLSLWNNTIFQSCLNTEILSCSDFAPFSCCMLWQWTTMGICCPLLTMLLELLDSARLADLSPKL